MRMDRKLHILALGLAFGSVASHSLSSLGLSAEFARPKEALNSGNKTDVYKMPNPQAQYLKHYQPERK
jgi:hypothetical protein